MDLDSRNLTTPAVTSGSVSAKCPICGTPLPKMPPSLTRKYCSRKCAGAAKKTLPTVKTCQVCGAEFQPKDRYQAARATACSKECMNKRQSAIMTGRPSPLDQRVTVECAHCGTPVVRSPSRVARVEKAYCGYSCRSKAHADSLIPYAANMKGRKHPNPRYGADNPAWKGGVMLSRGKGNYTGPRYVRCPEEWRMMARKDGYIMEHRLVMAQWVGRPLLRTEVVNHINRDPRDNRRENLELYPSNGDHKRGEVGRFVPGVANRYVPKV